MKQIAKSIAEMLCEQKIVQNDDMAVCVYGLDVFISSFIELISVFVLAAFIGNLIEIVLFFTAFIPLRVYAGGYHANRKATCYLISIAVYIAFTLATATLPKKIYVFLNTLSAICSSVMVVSYAPVIHHNKIVSTNECKVYRKKSILICFVEVILITIFTIMAKSKIYVTSFALGNFTVALSMLFAILKRKMST